MGGEQVRSRGILAILHRDNGQRAIARVRYCRFNVEGHREFLPLTGRACEEVSIFSEIRARGGQGGPN